MFTNYGLYSSYFLFSICLLSIVSKKSNLINNKFSFRTLIELFSGNCLKIHFNNFGYING